MGKKKIEAADLPTRLEAGEHDAGAFRVVDAATGEEIARVIEADATAGTLTRFAIEDGNLVRDGDRFRTIHETRAIRFEPVVAEVDDPVDAPIAGDVVEQEQG